MRVIGLMSGTSADGVDAALVEWPPGEAARPFRLLAQREDPFPAELQQRIHALAAGRCAPGAALRELAALDVALGERFAEAARAVAARRGRRARRRSTRSPRTARPSRTTPSCARRSRSATPRVIAERTGVTTVADFRPRDVAAGGEGAPLAPFFHFAAFADPSEGRVALNLGGIANVTWLPRRRRAPSDVIAFDVGPANALIDGVVAAATRGAERMDADGARALRGAVDAALLAELLDDDFLRAPPPKSTGRERYGLAEAEALRGALARSPARRPGRDAARVQRRGGRPRVSRAPRGARASRGCSSAAAARATPRSWRALARARCRAPRSSRSTRTACRPAPPRRWRSRCSAATRCSACPTTCRACTGARAARVLGEIVPGRQRAQIRIVSPSSAVSNSRWPRRSRHLLAEVGEHDAPAVEARRGSRPAARGERW